MSAPLLETDSASSIEIRDSEGKLLMVIAMIPGRPIFMISSSDQDEDFEAFCSNMGFKLTKTIEKKHDTTKTVDR